MVKNILEALINVSEKAANIARLCRQNEHLCSLLVEEKSSDEANPRFVQDFKTIADVLIQATVKHDIGNLYPQLRDNIKGEETTTFTNKLGESATIEVFENVTETAACLEKVLNDDSLAANLLAAQVHANVKVTDIGEIPDLPNELNYSDMGIWIDPIDATDQYIKAITVTNHPNIPESGLECVTVLIGAFDIATGKPIIGIINQPFYEKIEDNPQGYKSKIVWGIDMPDQKMTNLTTINPKSTKLAVISMSEDEKYVRALKDLGYTIVYSAGAGHKILKVINGDADLYLLSKNTTYKWDTCGPQAILNSMEGGLFKIDDIIEFGKVVEVDYDIERENRNEGGLLALRRDEKHILQELYNKK